MVFSLLLVSFNVGVAGFSLQIYIPDISVCKIPLGKVLVDDAICSSDIIMMFILFSAVMLVPCNFA